jgi:formyltetrahydrofolate deformylase
VAGLSRFIDEHGGNILHADHHIDTSSGLFLTRLEWDLADFDLPRPLIGPAFSPLAGSFEAEWELSFSNELPKVAIWVTKQDHCLVDLLLRHRAGELPAEIAVVISNHPDLEPMAARFGAEYHCFPISRENKKDQERSQVELMRDRGIDVIVLAKYMQILSPDVIDQYPHQIINIHHSFLPAFPGARPYHRAYDRGVKIIGATAHYVTMDLDEGPIIEQDIVRVSHRDSVEDLVRKGKDLERLVLARAVRDHLEHRVLVFGNKTVVFG